MQWKYTGSSGKSPGGIATRRNNSIAQGWSKEECWHLPAHRTDLLHPFCSAWPSCGASPPQASTGSVATQSPLTLHSGPTRPHPDIHYGILTLSHLFPFIPKLTFYFVLLVPAINSFQFLVSLFFFLKLVFSENRRKLHEGLSMASGIWKTEFACIEIGVKGRGAFPAEGISWIKTE